MKLIEILQGKWLGHPLHAAIVHLPVGGWLVACAIDVGKALGVDSPGLPRLALWSVGIGLAGAALAVPTGLADWLAIKPGKPARKLGLYHLLLNASATVVWTANFILRFSPNERPRAEVIATPILLTSIVGAVLVLVSAYLGSLMVFDHGIGVARSSKKKWREIAARAGANLADEK